MKQRVIAFFRVSTEEQAHKDRAGLPRQRASVTKTALFRNLEIVEEIELSNVSGSEVRGAPAFAEMMRKVKDKEVDGVVVSEIDRLIRPNDLADLEVLDIFRRAGATLHTEGSAHTQSSVEGILQSRLGAIFAGYERLLIKKRYQDAKESKRREGKCPSASITLPLGVAYTRNPDAWHYTPEVEKVKEAFRLVDEEGCTNLTDLSNAVGIAPRTLWNLLRNPIFAGWRIYDKKRGEEKYFRRDAKQADRRKVPRAPDDVIRVKVFDIPAVDADRFERVQQILGEKGAKWRRQRESIEINLGTGLAVCSHCGRKLYASSGRRSSGSRPGYYCCAANYYLNKQKGLSCPQPNVRKDHLDKTLISFITKFLASEEVVTELAAKLQTPEPDNSQQIQEQIKSLEREKARLLTAYVKGIIEEHELAAGRDEINSKIQEASLRLSKGAEKRRQKKEDAHNLRLLVKACATFKSITTRAEQQVALRGLLAKVAFDGQKIVGFVSLLSGVKPGCTEDGTRMRRDSSPRRASRLQERSRSQRPGLRSLVALREADGVPQAWSV